MDNSSLVYQLEEDICSICYELNCSCSHIANNEKCPSVKEEARRLFNLNYRKVERDQVVISRSEYDKLRNK